MCHNYWSPHALGPRATTMSLWAATTEACAPRTCALQQEKPLQWEAHTSKWRVVPAWHNWRKPMQSNKDLAQSNKVTGQPPFPKKIRLFQIKLLISAAAKSLQSCLTLCDPIDGSPPGSAIPGILQARTLEWVAISFSNAWKWKVKVKSNWGLDSVVSSPQLPYGLQATRLLRPWDFPGKSTGVGCHSSSP